MHIYVLDNFLYVLLHNRNGVILYATAESSRILIGSTVSHYLDVMKFQLYVSFGDPAPAALITCANIIYVSYSNLGHCRSHNAASLAR